MGIGTHAFWIDWKEDQDDSSFLLLYLEPSSWNVNEMSDLLSCPVAFKTDKLVLAVESFNSLLSLFSQINSGCTKQKSKQKKQTKPKKHVFVVDIGLLF